MSKTVIKITIGEKLNRQDEANILRQLYHVIAKNGITDFVIIPEDLQNDHAE